MEHKNHQEAIELAKLLDSIFPQLKNVPLETKALRIALSSGAESVSLGMRDIHQIRDNLKTLHFEPLQKPVLVDLLKQVRPPPLIL